MMRLIYKIGIQAAPVFLMIGLIAIVASDVVLSGIYIFIISASFIVHYDRRDILFFLVGSVVLFFSEYFFISTGVEVFLRHSLLNIMPLWLPILWGYAFVAIRRNIVLLEEYLK